MGIGATTAIFSVVNGVLLKPLPYPESERIMGLWLGAPDLGYEQVGISPGVFYEFLTGDQAYEAMGLYYRRERGLADSGDAERVPVIFSTAGLFDVLAVPALMGRVFTEQDTAEDTASVVVLSHGIWRRRFGGDPDILGRTVRLGGQDREVIGIMPPGFDFGGAKRKAELWAPLVMDLETASPGTFSFSAVARLRPDVTPEAAEVQETCANLLPRPT